MDVKLVERYLTAIILRWWVSPKKCPAVKNATYEQLLLLLNTEKNNEQKLIDTQKCKQTAQQMLRI